jgi:hypothetical protein
MLSLFLEIKMHLYFFLLFVFLFLESDPVKFTLGGPRKISGTINKNQGFYLVDIKFIPVNCFDPTTNKLITINKGRLYCYQALSNYLGVKGDFSGTFKNVEIKDTGFIDNYFQMKLQIPLDGIQLVKTDSKNLPVDSKNKSNDDFKLSYTSKDDYVDTLNKLIAIFEKKPVLKDDIEEFYLEISSAEEMITKLFLCLKKEVANERFWLTSDKDAFQKQIVFEETKIINYLAKCVKEAELKAKKEK